MIPAIVAALGRAAPAAVGAGEGAATSAISGAGSSIQGLVGSLTSLPTPMNLVDTGVRRLTSSLTAMPAKILQVQQAIVTVGRAWVEALAAPIKTVQELGMAVGQFVRFSNPAAVKMFEYRVENTFATIGRILEPIFNALSRAAERVGDTFAKLKPALAPAMKGIEDLIDLFMTRFVDSVELLAPGIQAASTLFYTFSQILKTIQEPITFLIRKFNELRRGLYDLLGIPTGFDRDAKSDIAIRQPQFTNINEIQKEMAKNSLMASLGRSEEKNDTPSLLKIVADRIGELPDKLVEKLKNVPLKVINVAKETAEGAGSGAASVATGGNVTNISRSREQALEWFKRRWRANTQES